MSRPRPSSRLTALSDAPVVGEATSFRSARRQKVEARGTSRGVAVGSRPPPSAGTAPTGATKPKRASGSGAKGKKLTWKQKPLGDLSEREHERWIKGFKRYAGAAQALNAFFIGGATFPTRFNSAYTFEDIEKATESLKSFCEDSNISRADVDDTILPLEQLRAILPP